MADEREISAKVPLEEYQAFRQSFPQYGAINWFINESLKEFNRRIRENPALKEIVHQSIAALFTERRNEPEAA